MAIVVADLTGSEAEIRIGRNTDKTIRLTVLNADGTARDITGESMKFTVREDYGESATVFISTIAGIIVAPATNGEFDVTIPRASTIGAPEDEDREYVFEARHLDSGALEANFLQGSFIVEPTVRNDA